MKKRRVTIKDVARAAGISTTCVSFVLNDRWRKMKISPETRRKVMDAARRLDFRPHVAAQELGSGKSKMLGLVLFEPLENPFAVDIISYLGKHADRHGFGLLLSVRKDSVLALKWLLDRNVAGVFVGPSFQTQGKKRDEFSKILRESGTKFVLYGWTEDLNLNFVNVDYFDGGYKSTEHLIGLGHKKIGYFGGVPNPRSLRDRPLGYRKALEEYGLEFRKEWGKESDTSWLGGYRAMKEFLARPSLPTALVGHSDISVLGGLRALAEKGLNVPHDMAIVGEDDITASSFGAIPLTTMTIPKDLVYGTLCKSLIGLVNGDSDKKQYCFKEKLVIRKSCGAK